ncbi:hypothetical protein LTR74_018146 [Friedmanniomyces endolithicus]|nr:hypothetical protein LTR74_018146 [Friedmanniomyces endolithicus]
MATGQNDTRLTTYLLQHAGGTVLEVFKRRQAIDLSVVKRTRTQERQLPRKSARLAGPHQEQLSPEVVRRKSYRHNLCSGVHRGENCTQQQQRAVSTRRLRTQNDPAAPNRTPERKRRRSLAEKSASVPALSSVLVVDEEHSIAHWAANKHWPEQYIEKGKDMENILARAGRTQTRDSTPPSSTNQGEQKSREQKSAEYKKPQYAAVLATKGVFMGESQLDISPDSQRKCRQLLEQGGEREIPEHSLFRDDLFKATCRKIQDKNEARIIQDITRLIVPSAETLNTCGATHLRSLTESVNEGWNKSIAITKTRPQPDYAVGFSREAFTQEQLDRMHPVVGDYNDQSYFMATWYMYFPFLTCEVKCGAAALDVADRQNAHSTAIAVRAVVELFRTVKREQELHREILAFSVSHDHCSARIYGHYAEFEGTETKLYRHTVHKFDFTALGGKEKWTAYKFTKNFSTTGCPCTSRGSARRSTRFQPASASLSHILSFTFQSRLGCPRT